MFARERARVMNIRTNRESFSQLLGEHAVHMCELAQANKLDQKKALMAAWVNIHKINDEWAYLVTRNDRPESEFSQVTHKLIHLYSEALADYIIDQSYQKDKIADLVDTETKFFNALGKEKSNTQWIAYTGSVISMVQHLERYGHTSDVFSDVAGHCIRSAILLGSWMDFSLK